MLVLAGFQRVVLKGIASNRAKHARTHADEVTLARKVKQQYSQQFNLTPWNLYAVLATNIANIR